jgi:hypothetical protein
MPYRAGPMATHSTDPQAIDGGGGGGPHCAHDDGLLRWPGYSIGYDMNADGSQGIAYMILRARFMGEAP